MCFNPAAAVKRYYGGVYTKYDKKKIKAAGTDTGDMPDQNLKNLNADWNVEDEIDSFRILYSDVKNSYNVTPEILAYKQSLETSYFRKDNTGTDPDSSAVNDSDVTMGQMNLAYPITDKIDIGIGFGFAKVEEKNNLSFKSFLY